MNRRSFLKLFAALPAVPFIKPKFEWTAPPNELPRTTELTVNVPRSIATFESRESLDIGQFVTINSNGLICAAQQEDDIIGVVADFEDNVAAVLIYGSAAIMGRY